MDAEENGVYRDHTTSLDLHTADSCLEIPAKVLEAENQVVFTEKPPIDLFIYSITMQALVPCLISCFYTMMIISRQRTRRRLLKSVAMAISETARSSQGPSKSNTSLQSSR